ncbi:MAG TPA: hypothetical protein VLF67_01765 [Candidatus Saccharimonas sp.]|nr:hypothetical protein [Candidatus Saccharimonas sp.]
MSGDIVKKGTDALQRGQAALAVAQTERPGVVTAAKVAGVGLMGGTVGEVVAIVTPATMSVGTFLFGALVGGAMYYLGRMVGRGQRR